MSTAFVAEVKGPTKMIVFNEILYLVTQEGVFTLAVDPAGERYLKSLHFRP